MLKIIVGKAKKIKDAQELKWPQMAADELLSLASTPNIFGSAQTFLLAGAINSERQDEFLDLAEALAESPNTFIFEEEKLLKAPTMALEKAGAKIEIIKKPAKEFRFDQYGVAAALGERSKKKLWLALMQAFKAGEKGEALAGLLAWKARQMGDADLSRKITFMYHDSHRGAGDLELLLERFALRL